jgi:hypothetical protein
MTDDKVITHADRERFLYEKGVDLDLLASRKDGDTLAYEDTVAIYYNEWQGFGIAPPLSHFRKGDYDWIQCCYYGSYETYSAHREWSARMIDFWKDGTEKNDGNVT